MHVSELNQFALENVSIFSEKILNHCSKFSRQTLIEIAA